MRSIRIGSRILAVILAGTWATQAAAQTSISSAHCDVHAFDIYGRPAAGVYVTLRLQQTITQDVDAQPDAEFTGQTDASGHVVVDASTVGGIYGQARCDSWASISGDLPYPNDFHGLTYTNDDTLSGSVTIVPRPVASIHLDDEGGSMDLYQSGDGVYDKPIVIAQPFYTDEPVKGPMSAPMLWAQYNGNPNWLSGGLLARLYYGNYDVWLFRPHRTGDNVFLQATDFAVATRKASAWQGFNNNVVVAGYSMGGLVVRTAMSRWTWDANWRAAKGLPPTPPVRLIVTLDSPLRGALVNTDLQHAFWNATFDNGQNAHDHNMDSCSAQQMLENACHKTMFYPDDLECNDRGWYQTFFGGQGFSYCNPYQGGGEMACDPGIPGNGMRTCEVPGAIIAHPNGGWPVGIRKIAASLGKIGERTGRCYGDAPGDLRDKRGNLSDGCPGVGDETFDIPQYPSLCMEWGYLSISGTDRHFCYKRWNATSDSNPTHLIDELTPGSRQPASVAETTQDMWVFRTLTGHQIRHAGTFIPLYSALDIDPATGSIPFDEYWTNSFSGFHDALTSINGTSVNQGTGETRTEPLVDWVIRNIASAFSSVPASYVVSVSRAGTGSGTVTSIPSGITCGSVCGAAFASGSTVSLTASAASGSTFAGWSGGGCSGTGSCTVAVNSAQSVTATFNLANGCGETTCVPAQGAYISHFTGAGCTGTESYYLPYDGYGYSCRTWDGTGQCGTIHRTVTNVSYKYGGTCYNAWPGGNTLSDFVTVYRGGSSTPSYALTVSRTGAGSGSVTSNPAGISCGSACSLSYSSGTVVSLTASAASGSTFAGWSGGGCSGTGACTVTMSAAQSVTATFNVSSSGSCGESTCVPAQGAYISHFTGAGCTGTESYYLPYDGYGYSCRTWDGTGQCGTIHRTVTNVSYKYGGTCYNAWPSGNTLSDFVTVYRGGGSTPSYALTVSRTGAGSGTVTSNPTGISCGSACSLSYSSGTVVSLTASAASGSTFAGWSGGGCSGTGACTVTMSAAQSVTATFNVSSSGSCGEGTCVPAQGAYISHFTGAGCTGTESYYLPYDGYGYSCRTWNGTGQCGTIHRTVTNVSYRYGGTCYDAWPGGNTLTDFVTVYR